MALSTRERPLNFNTLSAVARVINISPAWSAVRGAVQLLRSSPEAADTAPYRNAVRDVREFAALLRREADTIALALICGVALGGLTPRRSLATRARTGLIALSEVYRFDLLDRDSIALTVDDCARELARRMEFDLRPPPRWEETESPAAWLAQLRETLLRIDDHPWTSEIAQELTLSGRERLRERTDALLRGTPMPAPTIEDAIASAMKQSISAPLRWQMEEMTADEWSRIALSGLARVSGRTTRPPYWLALTAMQVLGFDFRTTQELQEWVARAKLYNANERSTPILRVVGGRSGRAMLIVRLAKDSVTLNWRTTPEVAGLIVPDTDLGDLLRGWAEVGAPPVVPPVHAVAVEIAAGSQPDGRIIALWERRILAAKIDPNIFYFTAGDRREIVMRGEAPVIFDPRGIADLATGLDRHLHA
jgi:hypothetical protein